MLFTINCPYILKMGDNVTIDRPRAIVPFRWLYLRVTVWREYIL